MSLHLQLLETAVAYALAHPEQSITAVVAILGSATHYQRTGNLPIGRLPYRHLKETVRELGDQYFGTKRPRGVPGLVVDASADQLEATLRSKYFESADLYSYEYGGEVLNFRRPNGTRVHPRTGQPIAMELHPRAFQLESDELLVIAHDEASRAEAWGDHLRETLLSWERGQSDMQNVFDETRLEYAPIDSERLAGIEVVS